MRVINADGSTPEMCGNGLRCVALYLLSGAWCGSAASWCRPTLAPRVELDLTGPGRRW
jgi:diaminopimelate epimerase